MKKFKFLLASLVFILIVLSCSQVKATAPTSIYNKYDLYDFITEYGGDESATIEGDKVILNKDITATTQMYFASASEKCEDIFLDLNGHYIYFNLTSSVNAGIWWNSSKHNLTITGKADSNNDFIRSSKGRAIYTGTTKSITVENITLKADESEQVAFGGYGTSLTNFKNVTLTSDFGGAWLQAGMTVNMDNVTFELGNSTCQFGVKLSGTDAVANLKNCTYNSSFGKGQLVWITANTAKATINGGTYNYGGSGDTNHLIKVESGLLEINDGSFKSKNTSAIRLEGGTVVINNGAFNGRENAISAVYDSELTIKGGSFKAIPLDVNDDKGAIAFSSLKTLANIIPEGYFITNETVTKNSVSNYNETLKEVSIYAKPKAVISNNTVFTYNEKEQKPVITVKDTDDKVLKLDTDYTIEYPKASINAGDYDAKVVFINNYKTIQSIVVKYQINKATYDISNLKFKDKTVTYNGKNQKISVSGLPKGITVTYKNNKKKKVGKYNAIAMFKVDTLNYNAIPDMNATFTILPKGTSLKKLTKGKKLFKATWKAQKTETTGYQLQYSTNKKFKSGNKTVTVSKNKTTSSTVKKLKAKKKYYVRIRTYKKVGKTKIYSSWSKSKNVTTKK